MSSDSLRTQRIMSPEFHEKICDYMFDQPMAPEYFQTIPEWYQRCNQARSEGTWTARDKEILESISLYCRLMQKEQHAGAKFLAIEAIEKMFESLYYLIVERNKKT